MKEVKIPIWKLDTREAKEVATHSNEEHMVMLRHNETKCAKTKKKQQHQRQQLRNKKKRIKKSESLDLMATQTEAEFK